MPRIHILRVTSIAILLVILCLFLHFNSRLVTVDNIYTHQISADDSSAITTDFVESKIDWVDYDLLKEEEARRGPGEHGLGVLLNSSEKSEIQKLMNVNGFNAVASDKISLQRSIKDLRLEICKTLKYSNNLPKASIIIPFHDEHWSTLLRTVYTLLLRAPKKLVEEIILVNDNSTKAFLEAQLSDYVRDNFNNVRVIKTQKREGLIRARLVGAKAATGSVLIFIDSHCEAGINWLPPLLEPIYDNYRTVTCPFIDVINENDFSIHPQDEGARGAFDWKLDYKRLPRLAEDMKQPEKPFASPIMAGGLFAISKKWFWELGGYDSGLEVWGGEQYELSFKIWMCGGNMIDTPCSRIAHVYRKFNPFGVPGMGDYTRRNYKRIAEVWMDEWKHHVYNKNLHRYDSIDPGDLTQQKALRKTLQCRTFDWFMKKVAFDLVKHYPPVEPGALSKGRIISDADSTMCIDSKFGEQGDRVRLEKCIADENSHSNGEQIFEFTWKLDIRPKGREVCFDYPGNGVVLVLFDCHNSGGNQYWKYNLEKHQLLHFYTNTCIDSKPQRSEIFMGVCGDNITQKWTLEGINNVMVKEKWEES